MGTDTANKMKIDIDRFVDYFVAFPSKQVPNHFEAHSLKTNQVGIGESVQEALFELVAGVRDLVIEASKKHDKEFCVWQSAPPEIVKIFLGNDTERIPSSLLQQVKQRFAAPAEASWVKDESDDVDLEADLADRLCDWKHDSPLTGQISGDLLSVGA